MRTPGIGRKKANLKKKIVKKLKNERKKNERKKSGRKNKPFAKKRQKISRKLQRPRFKRNKNR